MTTNIFKPILFSTEMVQAILAGRKTKTRRVIKIKSAPFSENFTEAEWKNHLNSAGAKLLYGGFKKGDILWVRETFAKPPITAFGVPYIHKAGFDRTICGWKPSIHMPKEAARIFLKVTNVRVERLQDISEEDAIAEGVSIVYDYGSFITYKNYLFKDKNTYNKQDTRCLKKSFQSLWQSINAKKHPWESNPWVWVYEFDRIEKPENFLS